MLRCIGRSICGLDIDNDGLASVCVWGRGGINTDYDVLAGVCMG